MPIQEDTRRQRLDRRLTSAAAIGTAVTGGVFFDFSFVVMPAVRQLPAAQGIEALQALNRTAVTALLMLLMYATAALCVALIVRSARRWDRSAPWILAAAIAFLLAAVVITLAGNVPVGLSVDGLDPSGTGASARWDDLFTQWVWWNHARTVTSIAAAAGFVIALRPSGRPA